MFTDIYSVSYEMKRQLYRRIFTVLAAFFICFVFINLVRALLVYPVLSESDSMSPEIAENNVVLVAPLFKKAERGSIMLVSGEEKEAVSFFAKTSDFLCRFFTAQQISLSSKNHTVPSLRRVVGLPGDTIYISNYLVYVKPAGQSQFLTEFELTKIKYTLTIPNDTTLIDKKIGAAGNMESITLGSDEYFVLADNRLEAGDSRLWGAVNSKSFAGRALMMYFPFSAFKIF